MKFLAAVALSVLLVIPVLAATTPISGEIKKINEAQGKVTLKHDPITNLDMGAMTMIFTLADPAMIEGLSVGDTVTFEADRVKGKLTVVAIQAR